MRAGDAWKWFESDSVALGVGRTLPFAFGRRSQVSRTDSIIRKGTMISCLAVKGSCTSLRKNRFRAFLRHGGIDRVDRVRLQQVVWLVFTTVDHLCEWFVVIELQDVNRHNTLLDAQVSSIIDHRSWIPPKSFKLQATKMG